MDWIATGVMILILGATTFPFGSTRGETARVALSPSTGVAGTRVVADVTGIQPGTALSLRWDGSLLQLRARVADSRGTATFRFNVPAGTAGSHDVSVVTASQTSKPRGLRIAVGPGLLLASATFSLMSLDPATTPPPAAPTVVATASPAPASLAPTLTPTLTPVASIPPPTPLPTPVLVSATPTPPPATPTPAPGCSLTFGGDKTGTNDVTASLQSFLTSAPAAATVCLAVNGQYRVDGQVHVARRENGLTIEGSNASLFATSRRDSAMLLIDQGGRNIVVRNLTLEGFNPYGRTSSAYDTAYEHGHGIALGGAVGVTIANVKILNMNGDGIYITGGWLSSSTYRWAESVSIRGILIDGTGRNGIAFTDGARNVTVSASTVKNTGIYAFDIEPNGSVIGGVAAGADGITITGNSISRYTISSRWGPYLFAASGYGPENNIEFSNNTVYGQALRITVQPNGTSRTNISILNNRSDTRVAGPTMTFSGCSGLTVTGNVQPLSSGTLASVSGCSNVTLASNVTS